LQHYKVKPSTTTNSNTFKYRGDLQVTDDTSTVRLDDCQYTAGILSSGTVYGKRIKATTGAGAGKIAVSNADGTLTWTDAESIRVGSATYALNGGGSGSGGVTISTFTFQISSGGDVFVASSTFIPIMGSRYVVAHSTIHVTGVEFYNLNTSTVGATTYSIAWSSSTGNERTWAYLNADPISVNADNQYSGIQALDVRIPPHSVLALHVNSIPTSGQLPADFGCTISFIRE
jgi:hypothetical protein